MSKIQVNEIVNHFDNGAPDCPKGLTVTGVSTFSGNVSIGGTLSYEDVTNIDSVGIITAQSGIHVTGGSIGIGTAIGAIPLHIFNSVSTVKIRIDGDSNDAIMSFANSGSGIGAIGIAAGAIISGGATNIGLQSNNDILFATGGLSERMRIDSSGNFGIGTTSVGAKLHIEDAGVDAAKVRLAFDSTRYYDIFRGSITNGGLLNFYGSQTGFTGYVFGGVDGERARIDSSGRLLVGTTSNNRKFVVEQANSTAYSSTDFDQDYHLIKVRNSTNDKSAGIQFSIGGNGEAAITATEVSDGAIDLCFGTRGGGTRAERMRITSVGEICIGTTAVHVANRNALENATTGQLTFRHSGTVAGQFNIIGMNSGAAFVVANASGATGVQLAYSGTSWTTLSDERHKTDLMPIDDGLAKVGSLRAVTGRLVTDPESKSRSFLIAQDVQAVLPQAVDTTDPDALALSYTEVVPLLVAALKESKERIEILEAKVQALEGS